MTDITVHTTIQQGEEKAKEEREGGKKTKKQANKTITTTTISIKHTATESINYTTGVAVVE
jgi:hypothetical protein